MNIQNDPTTTTDTTKPPLDLGEIEVGRWESHTATRGMSVALSDIIDEIRNPSEEVQRLVEEIAGTYQAAGRGKAGKDAIRSLKARLACVAFSATGTRREPEAATGLLCLDLDELGDKLTHARCDFRHDSHVIAVFVSPSGDGLKVIFRVPVTVGSDSVMRKAHRRIFKAAQKYVKKQFGLDVDPAASDLLRLCYLAHDPDVVLNEQASELDVERYHPSEDEDPANRSDDPAAKDGADPVVRTVNEEVVWALLISIPPRPDYETWMRICAAVRNALGDTERAIAMLIAWSPEEHPGEYRSLLESSSFSRIGYGTLLYHAGLNGFGGVIRKCFFAGKGNYCLEFRGEYICNLSERELREHLAYFGVDPKSPDCPTCKIRTEQLVQFTGPIAGHRPGLHEFSGNRFLVTKGPKIIAAGEPKGNLIQDFLYSLVGTDDEHQYDMLLAWLHRLRMAVKAGRRTQMPALVVSGSPGDGKSLLIYIAMMALGGRAQSAYRYLSGQTAFNAELVGSELLVIDDDAAATNESARRMFAQFLKSQLFAGSVRIEGKGRDAFDCTPVQGVIMAVNNEPDHLLVLPELDASMRDKIVLLETSRGYLPPGLARRPELIQQRVLEEMPGFLAQLEALDIEPFINGNTGRLICHWNENLLRSMCTLAPEEQLLELAYAQLNFFDGTAPAELWWEGTAAQMEAALTAPGAQTQHAARQLLRVSTAAGRYLSRLCQDGTGRVIRLNLTVSGRVQRYRIVRHRVSQSEESEETSSNSDNILSFPTGIIGRRGQNSSSHSSPSGRPHGTVPILEPGDVEIDTAARSANPPDAA